MAEENPSHGNYDHSIIAVNQLLWGEGFLSPGGARAACWRRANGWATARPS